MLRKQRQKGISMHRFTKPVVSLGIVVVLLAIALGTTLFATPRLRPTRAASAQTYIVLYKAQAVPADAANTILQAGGTLVYSYPQIGVVIASSDNTAFRDNLMTDSQIDSASATTNYGSKIDDGTVNGESSTDGQAHPQETSRTPRPRTAITCRRSSGTCGRSTPLRRTRSRAEARLWWSATSILASTSHTRTWRRMSTSPTASRALAACQTPTQAPGRMTTATGPTPRASSPRAPTASASSASRRT